MQSRFLAALLLFCGGTIAGFGLGAHQPWLHDGGWINGLLLGLFVAWFGSRLARH